MGRKAEDLKQYHWKPGESGNPKGRPIETEEQRRMRRLTKEELSTCASWLIKGDISELKAIKENPKSPIIHAMVASMAISVITKGDASAWEHLLNRIVGKVKDEVQIDGNAVKLNINLPGNGFEHKGDK